MVIHYLEQSPLKFWMLINEVGTGKTFTYLLSVKLDAQRLEDLAAKGETIEAEPTLIIVPAILLIQTFEESVRNFPELTFVAFFGVDDNIPHSDPRHGRTYSTKGLAAKMKIWHAKRGNPATARIVVLTTYSTIFKRWVKKDRKNCDMSKERPWDLDRIVSRHETNTIRLADGRPNPDKASTDNEDENVEDPESEVEQEDHDHEDEDVAEDEPSIIR